MSLIKLGGVYYVVYCCKDVKEMVEWYEVMFGMIYIIVFVEDYVFLIGEYDLYMYVFFDVGNGNIFVFFELLNQFDMGCDENMFKWVQYFVFKVGSYDELVGVKVYF